MSDSHDVKNAPQTSETEAGRSGGGDDVLDIIADVEGRLERLRKVSKESGAVVDSIHQKQAALDKRQAELNARTEEVKTASAALQQRADELDAKGQQIESLQQQTHNERQELDRARQTVEQQRHALAQERESLTHQQQELAEQRRELEAQQAQHQQQVETIAQQREDLQRQFTDAQEQRVRCDAEHQAAVQALDQRRREIETQHNQRADALQNELGEARKQVAALKEHLESQRAEASQTQQTHRHELEQAALRSDSLQADLDAAQKKAGEIEAALARTQADLQNRNRQLEATKSKLIELGKALDGQSEQIAAGAAALSALEDRDRRIGELESQLAAGAGASGEPTGIDPAEIATRDQRIATLESELESLQSQLQAAQSAPPSGENSSEDLAQRDQAIEELSRHIRSLQNALKQAQAETADRAAEVDRLTESLEELQTRPDAAGTASPGVSDEFAARRRDRLQRMRQAIRDRSRRLNKARDVVKQQAHQVKEIDDEKRTLQDVRRNLEQAEQRMIRRWARSSAVTNLFLIVLTLAILGAASYFGVMTFWPTAYTAHATIEAKGKPGFPLTDNQIKLWQTVHEGMLTSDSIVNAVAERLRQRGYTDLAEPERLKTFLESHLVTGSSEAGVINLELTAVGRSEAQRLLETYTIGLVSTSNAERGRRTDGATTNLAVPATTDALPAKDDRVQIAGIAFGSSVGAVLLLGLPLYLKLRRSASVFNDEDLDGPMMSEGRWDQISSGAQNGEHVIS